MERELLLIQNLFSINRLKEIAQSKLPIHHNTITLHYSYLPFAQYLNTQHDHELHLQYLFQKFI